ncbi:Ydc2-catalyt-domain-containing protein [Hypoxylon sp. NC1633]|nr:Ydc2-catalyt-domain-containing protein [Hypoxylon sp. NC1633]
MPPAPAATLPKLRNAQLKHLSLLCGIKTSGTKAELVERLLTAANARRSSLLRPPRRVLSIDLGILNLGYSLLAPSAGSDARADAVLRVDELRRPPRVDLHVWKRRELIESESTSPHGQSRDPEWYSPGSLAVAADRLLRQDMLPLQPTHVLIERQRWRSGGGSAVQEWTVRVNTVEAMLHASLRTLRELGHWDGEVVSVPPDRVARFWPPAPVLSGVDGGATSESTTRTRTKTRTEGRSPTDGDVGKAGKKAKKPNSKKHKFGVIANWLTRGEGDEVILPANKAAAQAVTRVRSRLFGARRPRATEQGSSDDDGLGKIDDLTDSLLQGMTWLKWQENKAFLLEDDEVLASILDQNITLR